MVVLGPLLKRLRQRSGIRAPKVTVRTQIAWHWRVLIAGLLVVVSVAGGAWIYDAGRSIAGFDSRSAEATVEQLKLRVMELESELTSLRGTASAADSTLKIERVAQQQLALQVKVLEAENMALKQDLAFFEGLVPASTDSEQGLRINRFRVDPDLQQGRYRYRMLLVHNGSRQQKEFSGKLQFVLQVRQDGKDAIIHSPPANEAGHPRYQLQVRHFQRVEGILAVPSGAVLKSVEVRIVQEGVVRARQTVNL